MSTSPLSIDVFVTPIRPYAGDPPQGPGDDPTWAPMSSTLITGENEAILIDALMTNGQADALAEWAKSFGKRITGIYIATAGPAVPGPTMPVRHLAATTTRSGATAPTTSARCSRH